MGKIAFGAAVAIIASMAVVSPALAATNLVTNGDFTAGLSGWTVTPGGIFAGTPDVSAIKGQAYITNAGGSGNAAAAANTFAAFGAGNVGNISTLLSNGFNTTAGVAYKLTFDYAQFAGAAGSEVLKFAVTGNDGAGNTSILKQGSETQTGGTDLNTIFTSHTIYFTGTGSPANIQFSLFGSTTGSTDGLLDNVVITAVPEASTWAMFILGFGALGVSYRRRKQIVSFG